MLRVEDWIDRCEDGNTRKRSLADITGIALHRINCGEDAAAICEVLKKDPNVRGMAYPFVIIPNGTIQQARPLTTVTPHSRGYNHSTIGIANIGDFTVHEPTHEQWISSISLCSFLSTYLLQMSIEEIKGHTDRPNASKDGDKVCPGRYWDMVRFKTLVRSRMREVAMAEMMINGVIA